MDQQRLVVFFAELRRDTIASPYELDTLSRAPVFATVPRGASTALHVAASPASAASIPDTPAPESSLADEPGMPTHDSKSPASSNAVVIRPLTPHAPARSFEQLASARIAQRREEQAAAAAHVPARDPLAHPVAPPRIAGAARPILELVPEPAADVRHRSTLRPAAPGPYQRFQLRRAAQQHASGPNSKPDSRT